MWLWGTPGAGPKWRYALRALRGPAKLPIITQTQVQTVQQHLCNTTTSYTMLKIKNTKIRHLIAIYINTLTLWNKFQYVKSTRNFLEVISSKLCPFLHHFRNTEISSYPAKRVLELSQLQTSWSWLGSFWHKISVWQTDILMTASTALCTSTKRCNKICNYHRWAKSNCDQI